MLRVGAVRKDIEVVVGPTGLARVQGRRHEPAGLGPVAATAQLSLPAQLGARKRHSHVMDHRILHRYLKSLSLAGAVSLMQGGKYADGHQHAGPGVDVGTAR